MWEAWFIAAVAEEELLFEASIHVGASAAQGLEKWADAFCPV